MWVKRIFDIISTVILLTVIWPIYLLLYLIVYFTSGKPVYFKQERIGKNGKTFQIIKFRTMVNDAVKMEGGYSVRVNDERFTPMGKIFRKYSFDELPQLINILKGEMSVVGPRPPLTFFPHKYEDYDEITKKRFSITPGLTGYAQIVSRNEVEWNDRFKYDILYVENYSFWFDMIILLKSILKVYKAEGIHGVYNS